DPRLGIDVKKPGPDQVAPKLTALRAYQVSLEAPTPPAGSYDAKAAEKGKAIFNKSCSSCHVNITGTDNNDGKLHSPAETGTDGAYAARTAGKGYRTTPLRALWQHAPYFHDGSKATLEAVVDQYDKNMSLKLKPAQKKELVEFLKSL